MAALVVLQIAALLLLPGCGGDRDTSTDPFLADLQRRCERLRRHVERETGHQLGKVELLVSSREKQTEVALPWIREILAQFENGPEGEALEAEARAMAESVAYWTDARVDRRGRIVFPDPAEPRGGLLGFLLPFVPKSEFARDSRALDLVLLHELIHVHQHRELESSAFYESIHSRADMLARRAVLEGHAEYLTRKIASRIGLADLCEKLHRARTEPSPHVAKEWARIELRVAAADLLFAYVQGEKFVASVVDKLGYEKAIQRIFRSPPSLAAVSRPEEYFRPSEPSRWGPILEDLRRWLARERGDAHLEVIALPMVRELTGDPAGAFREGFRLNMSPSVYIHILIADSGSGARGLHQAWTRGRERQHVLKVDEGLSTEVRRTRKPDDWALHCVVLPVGHARRNVTREGQLIIDVRCLHDSEVEQGAERLGRRALEFLTNGSWREAWLRGDKELLKSKDAGLRLAAVSRMRSFVPDEDWEVRWLGHWYEARDEGRSEEERTAVLAAAIEDPHPAVVTRGLRAVTDMTLWEIPWPLLRKRLGHKETAVRRAAWDLMNAYIGGEGRATPREALRLIAAALDDQDVAVRARAADSLQELVGEPGLAAVFRKALADREAWVRSSAIINLAIYEFEIPELLPELVHLLGEFPESAAEALGKLGKAAQEALPNLREALKNPEGRAEAAAAIWQISGDPAPLFALVRESVAKGTPQGLSALGEVGALARSIVPDVAKALAHENRWTRVAAAEALGKIGGRQAKEALSRRLEVERDQNVLKSIREALGRLGE